MAKRTTTDTGLSGAREIAHRRIASVASVVITRQGSERVTLQNSHERVSSHQGKAKSAGVRGSTRAEKKTL